MSQQSQIVGRESRALDVRGALKEGMKRLREARVPSHTLAAELLLMHVLGRERVWIYSHPEELLDAAQIERFFDLVARRTAGTPTQYLTGRQEFWGLEFEVTPDVLIPRPETEHVVEVALERTGPLPSRDTVRGEGLRIADVGTGSGCLAVALARELPGAEVFATDISEAALAVARRNAERHGVSRRIEFFRCSLLEGFLHESLPRLRDTSPQSLPLDLIVSNPPYVARSEAASLQSEVRDHEPAHALFGGEQGIEIYAPLIAQAEKLLRPGGVLVLELGYNSLAFVQPLLETPQWTDVRATNDLAAIPRVISAVRS
jgi:release factor glutamine methyltransferase